MKFLMLQTVIIAKLHQIENFNLRATLEKSRFRLKHDAHKLASEMIKLSKIEKKNGLIG